MSDGLISSHKVAYLWLYFKPQCGLYVLLNVISVINKPSSFFPMTGLLSVVRSGTVPSPFAFPACSFASCLSLGPNWRAEWFTFGSISNHLLLLLCSLHVGTSSSSHHQFCHPYHFLLQAHLHGMALLQATKRESKTKNLSESLNLYSYNKKLWRSTSIEKHRILFLHLTKSSCQAMALFQASKNVALHTSWLCFKPPLQI